MKIDLNKEGIERGQEAAEEGEIRYKRSKEREEKRGDKTGTRRIDGKKGKMGQKEE